MMQYAVTPCRSQWIASGCDSATCFGFRATSALRRRTIKLSRGGGRVSYTSRKAYLPPPSAAAPGSALIARQNANTVTFVG